MDNQADILIAQAIACIIKEFVVAHDKHFSSLIPIRVILDTVIHKLVWSISSTFYESLLSSSC